MTTLQLAWQPLLSRRAVVLIALFSLAALLLANIGVPIESAPRWPSEVAVAGWSAGPESVDTSRPGVVLVTRTLTRADGMRATFVLTTSPNVKAVFRAGAAVPFLGNGYSVEPAPQGGNREAFIARRGNEAWLQIAVYGERRGQFGSGVIGWSLATLDSMLARPNDYYLARIVAPYDDNGSEAAAAAAALANSIFPQLAEFYQS
jgi:hypothetical protein